MTIRYACTFEFETRPPLTHRGIVEASGVATAARRAVLAAQKALRPVNWSSMNCVFLERLDPAEASTEEDTEVDGVAV
jgi:hypothetical protein